MFNVGRAVLQGILAGLFFIPVLASSDDKPAPIRFSFGIVPQQFSTELVKKWEPLLRYLGEKTGYQLEFETAKDIPTFEQRLAAGQYDFAYLSPYTYTIVHKTPARYEAFAKEKNKKLIGIMVVRKDSSYQRLEDLRNLTLAFPDPAAIAASIIPRGFLQKQGIPFKPAYVISHDSVYLSVANGLYPAGGGVMRTYETADPVVREKLRILWTTPAYTPHPFIAHKRVPKQVIARLRAAMFAMDADPAGQVLLKTLALNGITKAEDKDYDDIRALGLTVSDHLLKKNP